MLMNTKTSIVFWTTVLFAAACRVFSQGTFVNLDFESANVQNLPLGQGENVAISNGVPGWEIFPQVPIAMMGHNALPLGGAAVVIWGPESSPTRHLEGFYTVNLIG